MSSVQFIGPFSSETYRQRRLRLIKELGKIEDDFVCLFWSGSEVVRSHDSHFLFRANSDFLYLTGFSEPDVLMILKSKGGKVTTSIGVRPRDLSTERGSEIWEGERLGVERATKTLGFDSAFDIHQASTELLQALTKTSCVFWNLGLYPEWDSKIIEMISQTTLKNRGIPLIRSLRDSRPALHEMRKIKSKDEIEVMRRSGNIASQGHIRAMATTRAGQYEYQVAAEVEREFKRLGAQHNAYNSIVATGANACTLHYHSLTARLKKGELILIDAGAELDGYASDVTRTYPVSGRFSKEQAAVYEIVLQAQLAAIAAAKAGAKFSKPHEEATRVISEGLRKLGIIKNKSTQMIFKKGLFKRYMPHGTSHWLGLDVHDLGRYRRLDNPMEDVPLVEGSVITVEPGLYFRPDDKSVPPRYRGIGVRIEDDVHITRSGPDVLTANCPKTLEAVEAACGPKL